MTTRYPSHSLTTWPDHEHVAFARGLGAAMTLARKQAESTGASLEVWKLDRGLRREKLAVVHPSFAVARVVLIGCSKEKRTEPTQACDMYTSPLFTKQLALARTLVEENRIFVVSAMYGLLTLGRIIQPYEAEMRDKSREHRAEWGMRVVFNLSSRMSSRFFEPGYHARIMAGQQLRSLECVLLMGSDYARPIRAAAQSEEWSFVEPLAGKQIGERLHWLNVALGAKNGQEA